MIRRKVRDQSSASDERLRETLAALAIRPEITALRQRKLGLVLAGGGGKGSYQIGCLKALGDLGLTDFHVVSGASVGALNGAAFASGRLEDAENLWLTMTPRLVARFSLIPLLRWMLIRPAAIALSRIPKLLRIVPWLFIGSVVTSFLSSTPWPVAGLAICVAILICIPACSVKPRRFAIPMLFLSLISSLTGLWYFAGYPWDWLRFLLIEQAREHAHALNQRAIHTGSLVQNSPLRATLERTLFPQERSHLPTRPRLFAVVSRETAVFDPDFPSFVAPVTYVPQMGASARVVDIRRPGRALSPMTRGFVPDYVRINGATRDRALDVLLASAALPEIFPRGRLEDRWVLDGGMVDNVPVLPALEAGCDVVIVIYLRHDRSAVQGTVGRLPWLRRIRKISSGDPVLWYRKYVRWLYREGHLDSGTHGFIGELPHPGKPYLVPLEPQAMPGGSELISVVPSARLELVPGLGTLNFFRWGKAHLIERGYADLLVRIGQYADGLTPDLASNRDRREPAAGSRRAWLVWRLLVNTVGEERRVTLVVRANLAQHFRRRGDLERAQAHQTAAWEAMARRLGDEDYDTLTARNNLATILLQRGEVDAAGEHQRFVISARERRFGSEHPSVWIARSNYADVLQAAGESRTAAELARSAAEGLARILGPRHADVAISRYKAAANYYAADDRNAARVEADAAWEAARHAFGETDVKTLQMRQLLVELALAGDEPALARTHQEAIATAYERSFGSRHPRSREARMIALALAEHARETAGRPANRDRD